MIRILVVIFLFLETGICFSQIQHAVDSLNAELKKIRDNKIELNITQPAGSDSASVIILLQLAKQYIDSDFDKAKEYTDQALELSRTIGYKKGIANSLGNLGIIFHQKGYNFEALEYHKKSLAIRDSIGDDVGVSRSYNNIGLIYYDLGKYSDALDQHLSSLKIKEKLNDRKGMTNSLNNIGLIFYKQQNYSDAMKNYLAAIKICKESNDTANIIYSYTNLGNVYKKLENYDEANRYYMAAISIASVIGNKYVLAVAYDNLGNVLNRQKKYKEALEYFQKAIVLSNEMGQRQQIAILTGSIGLVYLKMNRLDESSKYLYKALSLSNELEDLGAPRECYSSLYELETARGNYKSALEFYRKYIEFRDSTQNDESIRKVTQLQVQYEYDKKEVIAKAEQEKKSILAEKKLQREKLIRNLFVGGSAILLIFSGVFLIQRNRIRKEKMRSENLLLNILPRDTADELMRTGNAKTRYYKEVTVMFTDFREFTKISAKISPEEVVQLINYCYSSFDHIISKYKIEKIKTIGDSYMCAAGLPLENISHAEDMINAALEIRDFMTQEKIKRELEGKPFFEVRIGINSGPVVAGIVGVKKFAYDIWGDTVNVASRMESNGEAGKINISAGTYLLVNDLFNFQKRGKIDVKDIGVVEMYFAEKLNS